MFFNPQIHRNILLFHSTKFKKNKIEIKVKVPCSNIDQMKDLNICITRSATIQASPASIPVNVS